MVLQAKQRMMVQIDAPGQQLDLAKVRDLLSGTGLELDERYGVIPINPSLGRYVVRGSGDEQTKAALRNIDGVQVFSDPGIAPIS